MNSKHLAFGLIAASILTSAAYGFYRLGVTQGTRNSPPQTSNTELPNTKANDKKNEKILYWHDPMVPSQKFDKPGKSPFMDMQLVPVYADGDDAGTVNISARVKQNLGVRIAEVSTASLTIPIIAVGSVVYNERDVSVVQARSNGFIEKLHVRAPMDLVKKGQVLAELYVPDWIAAQEEFLAIKHMQSGGIEGLLGSARQRMRLVGMTDEQIHTVENSGKVHSRIAITAPISGVMTELSAREGMTAMTGASLFRINGLSRVWINADIPENLAAQVRIGSPIEARTASLPGTLFKGKIAAILPQIDIATRTIKARIELANPTYQLVPGMFVTLRLHSDVHKNTLLIPSEAIIQTGTRSVVIVAQGDGHFLPTEVEIGIEANGQTEILKGLDAGQKLVISGQFLIDSEASLKGATTRMAPASINEVGRAEDVIHHGTGKVERIDKDSITLSHEPIKTLEWSAMTMRFQLPASGLSPNVAVGGNVYFEIRASKEGGYQIVAISPVAVASKQSPQGETPMPSLPAGVKK